MRSVIAIALVVAGCSRTEPDPVCVPKVTFPPAKFFRVEHDCDRWTLVKPDGLRFFSTGINAVNFDGIAAKDGSNPYRDAVRAKYADEAAWADATAARMREWGWNTVGSWSTDASLGARLPYTHNLSLSGADWQSGTLPDYFDEAWVASVNTRAEPATARKDDTNLVGWFIDNEMRWGPDWRSTSDLFSEYARKEAGSAGKKALVALLQDRHGTVAHFNEAWGTAFADWDAVRAAASLPTPGDPDDRSAFITLVAHRFFEVTTTAIRSRDPNHLVLGVRFVAGLVPLEVAREAGKFLDVVSANAYEFVIPISDAFLPDRYGFVDLREGGFLEALAKETGRPILVSEFGFRAADSGLPNTWPPQYPTLATQTDRADRFEAFARKCHAAHWIVGYHWFEWADQPPAGRFDGENNNWGVVSAADVPYDVVVSRMAAVQRELAP